MIARRDAINYYPFNPVILPNGIKPVPAKTVLSIGEYKKPETGKRKRNQTVDEFRSDGTLGDSQDEEFKRRYLQPLRKNDQSDASILTEWMHARKRLTENKYTPLQTVLSNTKIPHSFRTVQFVSLVSKMERRILQGLRGHPEDNNDDDDFDMSSSTAANSKLLIPKRQKSNKSSDDSRLEIVQKPVAQQADPVPSKKNGSRQREASTEDEMELADDILQDVITATHHSPVRTPQRPMPADDKPMIDIVEGSQDGAHDKPSFVFISSEDAGIFGKHIMESPIKPVIKPHTEPNIRPSPYHHIKPSTEIPSNVKFTFNDHIVPVYSFEAEGNLNSVHDTASSRKSTSLRPIPYSSKGHSVLLKRWSILSKQNGKSLMAIEEALQEYLSKEYKASGKPFSVQRDEMQSMVQEYDDDMDFDDNIAYQTDEDDPRSPNGAGNPIQNDATKNKKLEVLDFPDDFGFDDDFEDMSSLDDIEGSGPSHKTHSNSAETPNQMLKNDDTTSNTNSDVIEAPAASNNLHSSMYDSDEDCLEFDFAELDLTILENKLDLEGGYTPAERSPPFRSTKSYPEVIALSSDSDTPVQDDNPRRNDNSVSDEEDILGYISDNAMTGMPSASPPTEQSRVLKGAEELLATSREKSGEASLQTENSEHGHPSSNIGTMSQQTSPINHKHAHAHAQRRQRVLYSSQTDDAFSTPLRPAHTSTSASLELNSSPPTRRIAPKIQRIKSSHSRQRNPFLDLEASESGEGGSSDVEDDQRSSFMDSFIDDNTIGSGSSVNSPNTNRPASTNMYAIYRQSLISPEQQGSNNIFNHTNRPRYLRRVLENLDNVEEGVEEDSLDLTEPSERTEPLLTSDQPTSQNSHASDSAHLANSYDSDFM